MNRLTSLYLFLGGLTLLAVGSFISFVPTLYLTQFVKASELNIEILSEMRGMGGTLLVFGLFIIISAFRVKLTKIAHAISILIFSSFFLFRTIGIVIDGIPNQGILAALGVELFFAVCGVILWLKNGSSSEA